VRATWPLDDKLRRFTIRWPSPYRRHPGIWLDPIRVGMRSNGARMEHRPIPQPDANIGLIEIASGSRTHSVAIDYGDLPDVAGAIADSTLVYFKMQFSIDGYADDRVVPGGYVTGSRRIYQYLPVLRALRGRPRFTYDVYARFGLRHGAEVRKQAVEALSAQSDFRYRGGLFRYEGGPDKVPYGRYLMEISRSKVCVDLPGRGDLCFRLADYLALGACVVRPPLRSRLHVPLVEGEHFSACATDLSDLVEVCDDLVHADARREAIGRRGREFFARYLHRRQLAAYYLSEISKRL
jgi:hypothetical protein